MAVLRLSLVAERGSSCECRLLLLWSTGSRHMGFSSCHTWAQSSWRMGLATPWHVESSNTRDQTYVPCIGRWTLIYLATREAPLSFPIVVIGLWFSLVKVGRFVSLSFQRARFLFFCCFSFTISLISTLIFFFFLILGKAKKQQSPPFLGIVATEKEAG